MKRSSLFITAFIAATSFTALQAQTAMEVAADMVPGWNLGNTLEAGPCDWLSNELDHETAWQETKTTQKIIDYVKEMGFRSVRIPCAWYIHMDQNYNISPVWMDRVQEVVDYCIKDSLYVVLNDHWDSGWVESSFKEQTPTSISKNAFIMGLMWKQIALRFKDYDHHLLFAGLNEPDAAGDNSEHRQEDIDALIKYEQAFINAVRQTGGNNAKRILVVQGPTTNIDLTYQYYQMPTDPIPDALMLEVHFYSPYNFCQMTNDEWWGRQAYYWGAGNHVEGSSYNSTWGEEDYIQSQMRQMKSKFSSKGIPVILGEYGTLWRSMPEGESQEKHDDSVYAWYRAVCRYSVYNGIVPFVWDTNFCGHPSGTIIDRKTLTIYNQRAYDGIMDGCASVKWPYISAIDQVQEQPTTSSGYYTLTGIRLDSEPDKGLYIKEGKVYYR